MNTHTKLTVVAALAGASLLLPALASARPTPLVSPAIPGVAALPGPIAPASTPPPTMTTLTAKPDIAPAGKPFVLTGSGLPANKSVAIVWGTANVTGSSTRGPTASTTSAGQATKVQVVLAQAQTDAQGQLSRQADGAA